MSDSKVMLATKVKEAVYALFESDKPEDKRLVAQAMEIYARLDQQETHKTITVGVDGV
jgi:predicted transcriptional regulator YdeE